MVEAYLISAVVFGSLFALMAVGLTLTYITTKVPNFAFGSFVALGIYTSYSLFKLNAVSPYLGAGVAFLVSGFASVLTYLLILRPLSKRGASLVSQMIATLAVDIAFVGVFGIYIEYIFKVYNLFDAYQFPPIRADFQLFGIPGMFYVAPVTLASLAFGLFLLLTRTKFGVAMRAAVENPPLARVLGINVERVYVVSWLIAGGLAGLAGAYYTLWLGGRTTSGSEVIVDIFAASILGGLGSVYGAVLGGLTIGGSEITMTVYLAQGFGLLGTSIIVGALLILGVLLIRRPKRGRRVIGAVIAGFGAYVAADVVLGYPLGFISRNLVEGFGAGAYPYQKGIPLLIMIITLLILPQGLFSIKWKEAVKRLRGVRENGAA